MLMEFEPSLFCNHEPVPIGQYLVSWALGNFDDISSAISENEPTLFYSSDCAPIGNKIPDAPTFKFEIVDEDGLLKRITLIDAPIVYSRELLHLQLQKDIGYVSWRLNESAYCQAVYTKEPIGPMTQIQYQYDLRRPVIETTFFKCPFMFEEYI